ncbi:MAG: GMC family oxidoreductase N-terminal domain-containing protein [Pseudomonadota bacterium]|nr:GMC family oxidoreductase N-terminal domain-containing protein [Pseudomonadota bacterium]
MPISSDKIYDYIIVGGGSAGCVVASRLSANPNIEVLLIEAGEDFTPENEPQEIRDVFPGTAHGNPRFTWNQAAYFSPRPSNAPDERKKIRYAQGRVIGGGSSVNGMISIRGLPSDYSGWEDLGATGWNWKDVLPHFCRIETDLDYGGPLHGDKGPLRLKRVPEEDWPGLTKGFMEAAKEMGWQNIGDKNGVFNDGYFSIAVANAIGRRESAANTYLSTEIRQRSNIKIMDKCRAERVLFTGKKATGLRILKNKQRINIKANEVIISCGALHSPALLLRSGIGPANTLSNLNIDVIADRKGVGKHLMEHPGVNFGCYMRRAGRLPPHLRPPMYAGLRWSSGLEGCPSGDMYMIPMNKSFWHAIGERLAVLMMWVNKSYSEGEVSLNPLDPMAEPLVDFNMCSDPRDMERLKIGVRKLTEIQEKNHLQQYVTDVFPISYSDRARSYAVYGPANKFKTWIGGMLMDVSSSARRKIIKTMMADGPTIQELNTDDATLTEWINGTVFGHYHASCSNRMGSEDDPGAVTDPSARVYGVEGLRVADASIMPAVPSANTNLPTVMVGEKVAQMILDQR